MMMFVGVIAGARVPAEVQQSIVIPLPVPVRSLQPRWTRPNKGTQDKVVDIAVLVPSLVGQLHFAIANARRAGPKNALTDAMASQAPNTTEIGNLVQANPANDRKPALAHDLALSFPSSAV